MLHAGNSHNHEICILLPRELRQYSNRKVFIALGAMIGTTFIATAATVFTITALLIYRQGAQTHNDTRLLLASMLTNLAEAESGQRGFILTGDSAYLTPYTNAVNGIEGQYDTIKTRMAEEPSLSDVVKLGPLINQKLQEMAQTVALRQTGDTTAALTIIQTGTGQALTTQIRTIATAVQDSENAQLARDRDSINWLATLARDISVISLIATLALAVLVYWLYLKAIQSERALDRAKDEFVSLASHQLRTPATGIKSILSTLVDGDFGPLNDKQAYFMRRALESNQRELGIIEELLNVAKADAGRLVLHTSTFEMGELISTITSEQQPAIDRKELTLKVKQPDKPIPVVADEEKLYMAIGNLIDNARKYTPEKGQITVQIARHRRDVRVEVSDTGVGISSTELKHIFDRFQRASDMVQGNVEGAGLGLYLARRIAELHDGTIEVSSKLGKGTKFVMILPQGDAHAAEGSTG